MSKRLHGQNTGKGGGAEEWIRFLDDGLIWQQPVPRRTHRAPLPWWPGLEQQMADWQALYERACSED